MTSDKLPEIDLCFDDTDMIISLLTEHKIEVEMGHHSECLTDVVGYYERIDDLIMKLLAYEHERSEGEPMPDDYREMVEKDLAERRNLAVFGQ